MPRGKKQPGLLGRLDAKTAGTLGIVLASAVSTWIGTCKTNERQDATAALVATGAEIDAAFVDSLKAFRAELQGVRNEVKQLKARRRVLVVDTLRVAVVVKNKPGLWARFFAPAPRR